MDLSAYARLSALLYDVPEADQPAVFAAEGTSRAEWESDWGRHSQTMSQDPEAYAAYTAAFREALESRAGPVRDLTEHEYVQAEVARRLQRAPDHGELGPVGFLVAQYRFTDTLQEPRQQARIEARTLLACNEALGKYTVRPLPPPQRATRIRERRCPGCGAHKHTLPRTPHVFCDYCGTVMDYDHERARVTTHGLDPGFVFTTLLDGVRQPIRDAWEAGDLDTWRGLWAWVYATDMELNPEGWSPRVHDDGWRQAMIDWSVETCRVANGESRLKEANERASEAFWKAMQSSGAERRVRRALQLAVEAAEVQVEVWQANGLFLNHPDHLSPEVWLRVNRAGLVDEWRPWLDDAGLARVRAFVDEREQWVDVPQPDLTESTCGCCGGALVVVDGARALVCESCGTRLDAERPRFPCPNCRVPVVIVPEAREIHCSHCDAVFLPG